MRVGVNRDTVQDVEIGGAIWWRGLCVCVCVCVCGWVRACVARVFERLTVPNSSSSSSEALSSIT